MRKGEGEAGNTWKLNVPAPNARLAREGSGKCLDKCQIFIENKQQQQEEEKKTEQTNKQTDKQDAKRTDEKTDGDEREEGDKRISKKKK